LSVLRYRVHSDAAPNELWPLLARPGRWPEWAPHLRGAWGLGEFEVETGASGAARLLGVVPIPATITGKRPGRSWAWRVGPVEMDHRLVPQRRGTAVEVTVEAPAALELALRASYGPVMNLALRRLAARPAA
jgi:Polyketide cyclase / dehydrase and lipid transport